MNAVSTVCERSFFALVEPPGPRQRQAVAGGNRWYEATVAFDGPLAGRFCIVLPPDLAHELFAAFLGCDEAQPAGESALHDVLGELANMACGRWLTLIDGAACFTLAHPSVRSVDEANMAGATLLAVNEQPLIVSLEVAGRP
ncbi:MAG: chemotaxis protein CheX [Acidobacteria bacterium]|nr:chemotaxis protein CheX [Acidobacteriota bacterium]